MLSPSTGERRGVVVLFTQRRSVYGDLGVECFDQVRDARTYSGSRPVVAHPPCRQWGPVRGLSKHRPDEKALAVFAVETVRRVGGVLEHPAFSTLWDVMRLPRPGAGRDAFGGWTLPVDQSWFGHRAPKRTWLYVVGVEPTRVPSIPFHLGSAIGRVASMSERERERTPPEFAAWLVDLAMRCSVLGGEDPDGEGVDLATQCKDVSLEQCDAVIAELVMRCFQDWRRGVFGC